MSEEALAQDIEAGRTERLLLPQQQPSTPTDSPSPPLERGHKKTVLLSPGTDIGESWVHFIGIVAEKAAAGKAGGSRRKPFNPFLRKSKKRGLSGPESGRDSHVPVPLRMSPKPQPNSYGQVGVLARLKRGLGGGGGSMGPCANQEERASGLEPSKIRLEKRDWEHGGGIEAEVTPTSPLPTSSSTAGETERLGPFNLSTAGDIDVAGTSAAGVGFRNQGQPPRVSYVGVALNGLGVILAGYGPFGAGGAKHLIKEILVNPSEPILPGKRYSTTINDLTIHMRVDDKNRVFACITAKNYPLVVSERLLGEVLNIYHTNHFRLRPFSTKEMCYQKVLGSALKEIQGRYERIERDQPSTLDGTKLHGALEKTIHILQFSSGSAVERARHLTALNISALEHYSEERAQSGRDWVILVGVMIALLAVAAVVSVTVWQLNR